MTKQQELIKADTVYGLIQSVNDILRDRFTSKGRTLDDNSWRGCPTENLEVGFWKAVRDRDFGSVLTYSAMLAGRDVNVADLIHDSLESYNEQIVKLQTNHAECVKKIESDHRIAAVEAGRKMETMQDTIRLMGITEGQHEQTISHLRAKLDDHSAPKPYFTVEQHEKIVADLRAKLGGGNPEPYRTELVGGVALESERTPELCYSVETVCGELVETVVIQGDPAAVKDLVQMVRAENIVCDGPKGGVGVVVESSKAKVDPAMAEAMEAAISGCTSIDIAALQSSAQTTPNTHERAALVSKAEDVAKRLFTSAPAERHKDPKVELAMAWHSGDFHRVMRAFETLYVAGKDPVAFVKRMKNVAIPPDND